jgi:hypothetical protein
MDWATWADDFPTLGTAVEIKKQVHNRPAFLRIQITPQEVFSGKPANPLTVQTSQAACLPEIAVGDQWLFFSREEKGKPIVLDYYANGSFMPDIDVPIRTTMCSNSPGRCV